MFLNIVTPCSRPENLIEISKSINIPVENYRWLIIFDMDIFPNENLIPKNCEIFLHRNDKSIAGHSQRNFAINLIKKGYVYQNDDDTIIHPELWENIVNTDDDFIHFQQLSKNGQIRLTTDKVAVNHIDSHNFIVSNDLIGNTRFFVEKYDADGYFAVECFNKSKKYKKIDKPLSVYNFLR